MVSLETFSQDQVNIYRAWDKLPGEGGIIDCDVAPRFDNPIVFESIEQVRGAISNQLDRVPNDAPPLLGAKLKASLMYLDVKEGKKQVDYAEYIGATMGMTPTMFSEAELETRAAELEARVKEYGLNWDKGSREDYQRAVQIREGEEAFKNRIRRVGKWANGKILGYVEGEPAVVEPTLLSEDKPWRAGTLTDGNGDIVLEVNTHPRHVWYPGKVAEAMIHEPAHAIQLGGKWKQAIKAGRMNQALGMTTLFTPETTHLEGVALLTSMMVLADEQDSPEYTYQAVYSPYYQQVMANVGIMVNTGHTEAETIVYMEDRFPLGLEDDSHKAIADRRDNPMSKAYLAAYGLGLRLVLPILDMPKQEQRQVTQTLYNNSFTPDEVAEVVAAAA